MAHPLMSCAPSPPFIPQKERHPKRKRKKLHDLSDVSSVGMVARGALDEYRFNMFMRDLLSEKAKDIFRCKGVLCVHVSLPAMCYQQERFGWALTLAVALAVSVIHLMIGHLPLLYSTGVRRPEVRISGRA